MSNHGPWNPAPLRTADDEDMDALSQLGMARGAGGALAVAGLSTILSCVQIGLVGGYDGILRVVTWFLVALGVAMIALAAKVAGAWRWATVTAIASAGVLFVVTVAWAILAWLSHFIAFFLLLSPVVYVTALVLAIVALPTCDRAERARARLSKEGIDLGV